MQTKPNLNPIADKTTVPILKALKIPIRYKGIYTPYIPFIPFFILWYCAGIFSIVIFGGIALLWGKEDQLIGFWFDGSVALEGLE